MSEYPTCWCYNSENFIYPISKVAITSLALSDTKKTGSIIIRKLYLLKCYQLDIAEAFLSCRGENVMQNSIRHMNVRGAKSSDLSIYLSQLFKKQLITVRTLRMAELSSLSFFHFVSCSLSSSVYNISGTVWA